MLLRGPTGVFRRLLQRGSRGVSQTTLPRLRRPLARGGSRRRIGGGCVGLARVVLCLLFVILVVSAPLVPDSHLFAVRLA